MVEPKGQRGALWRRQEQLDRWYSSDINLESIKPRSESHVKFEEGCVFLAACASGDEDEVERLLAKNADINTSNIDGLTALHQACIDDNLDMVEFLIEHGADINVCDNEGWTPLHATASCGYVDVAEYLIEQSADVAAANNDGELAVDLADRDDMETLLYEEMQRQGVDADAARRVEEDKMLADANQWLNNEGSMEECTHQMTGATPLHVAAAKGYIHVMNVLLEAGCDTEVRDYDDWTPLHAAAHWGQEEACKLLAENFCNMEAKNNAGETVFDVAVPDLLKLLRELKEKQATLKKDRKDLGVVYKRAPPLRKRRSSVTRMSLDQKQNLLLKNVEEEGAELRALLGKRLSEKNEEDRDEEEDDEEEEFSTSSSEETSSDSKTEKQNEINRKSTLSTKPQENNTTLDQSQMISMPKIEDLSSIKLPPPKAELTIGADDISSAPKDPVKKDPFSTTSVFTTTTMTTEKPSEETKEDLKKEESKTEELEEDKLTEDNAQDGGISEPDGVVSVNEKSSSSKESLHLRSKPEHASSASEKEDAEVEEMKNRFSDMYKKYLENAAKEGLRWVTAASTAKSRQSSDLPYLRRRHPEGEISTTTAVLSVSTTTSTVATTTSRRSYEPPKRDEKRETERKARAKRARETRRSTQGVTKEEIEMAEKTLHAADKNQELANRSRTLPSGDGHSNQENQFDDSSSSSTRRWEDKKDDDLGSSYRQSRDAALTTAATNTTNTADTSTHSISSNRASRITSSLTETTTAPSATSLTRTAPYRSRYLLEQEEEQKEKEDGDKDQKDEDDPSQKTSAIRARRRRSDRRLLGKIAPENLQGSKQEDDSDKDKEIKSEEKKTDTTSHVRFSRYSDSPQYDYVDSYSGPTSTHTTKRMYTPGSYSSQRLNTPATHSSQLSQDPRHKDGVDYEKLYEEQKMECEENKKEVKLLQMQVAESRLERERLRIHCDKSKPLHDTAMDKREKRALEKKLSEMEDQIRALVSIRADNQKLKEENGALIRVISKLSK